ncbi:MAG: hydrogenase maturation nickel metallochaperone HypA [Lentisphaerae bacterium GWF2_52_8]|nr:MAG: hydrogenase maturation nickel metallochaperone HypA [Lentisphaerae bacterium GWF2_52_8]
MHELSLAESLLLQVEKILRREKAKRVLSVTVQLGPLAGVEQEPFEFAFNALCEDSLAKGASLTIEKMPVKIFCSACQKESGAKLPLINCGHCGGSEVKIVGGKEFLFKSMEIE